MSTQQIETGGRRPGRTTQAMLAAPPKAVYIWLNGPLDYPRDLARRLGRLDLEIVSPDWLIEGRWVGRRFSAVIKDHACRLDEWQWRQYIFLRDITEADNAHKGTRCTETWRRQRAVAMIPVQFPEANAVLANSQDEYEPLPVHCFNDPQRRVACCFRLSPAEVEELCRTKTLWVQQLTFGQPFQPIALSTQRPGDLP